jgi:hypothetical protein
MKVSSLLIEEIESACLMLIIEHIFKEVFMEY